MSDQTKISWPKTADGTTDWEVVFEDPSMGFVPLILKAQTPVMAEKTATIILQKLFTRRSDLEIKDQYINRLGSLIKAQDDTDRTMEDIVVLMREIKDERIEKARVYIERQAAGSAIDRRSGLFWKIDALIKPKVIIPLGLLFVVALSGLVYFMLQTTLVTVTDRTATFGQINTPDQTTMKTGVEPGGEPGQNVPQATKPDPIPILLKTIRWPFNPKTSSDRSIFYAVILYVADREVSTRVCRFLPNVMDGIHIAFNQSMPQSRPARVDEIAETEFDIKRILNATFNLNLIENVIIAQYGSKEFKAASLPPFCRSP